MKSSFLLLAAGLGAFTAACGRDSRAASRESAQVTLPLPLRGACDHTMCGNDFFVDAALVESCAVGEACAVALTLVAAGDYHINDEYPYKFKADDAPGVEFLGTDVGGKNVFSKLAKNWTKNGAKTGTMTVTFKPLEKGSKAIGGVFRFSVCSSQNCRLEQQEVSLAVAVRDAAAR
jgi:hypothetical protein